jgi:DNA-binding PadR family transcriptional regulator
VDIPDDENDLNERDERPLRPLVFELLLLLQRSEQHGYALMRALADRAERRFVLGPATLYRTLKELRLQNLIETVEPTTGAVDDERRRIYRLTERGRTVAGAEAARLDSLVADARAARLLGRVRTRREAVALSRSREKG